MPASALPHRIEVRKLLLCAGCVGLAVLVGACGGTSSGKTTDAAGAPRAKAIVRETTQTVERLVASAAGALGLDKSPGVAAPAAEEPDKTTPAPGARRRQRPRLKRVSEGPDQGAVAHEQGEPELLTAAPANVTLASLHLPEVVPDELPVLAAPGPDLLYSGADRDVEPPSWQTEMVSAAQLAGRPADIPALELIVATDGSVERARLLSGARQLTDMMILSGAKMWKFDPALRDGMPVRYRMIVRWDVR